MITAIYHCSIKIIGRADNKSAVAAAAYRAGEKIFDERYEETQNYSKRKCIVFTEIMLPEYAPKEFSGRATLWNSVEKIEKAKNSQLAREIEISLPCELTREQQIKLDNATLRNLKTKIFHLEKWLNSYEPQNGNEENLIEKLLRFKDNGATFNHHLNINLKNFKNAKSLRDISKCIAFLQENNISNVTELGNKIKFDKLKYNEIAIPYNEKVKRQKELAERINQSDKPQKMLRKEYDELTAVIKSDRIEIDRLADGIARMETIKMNITSLDKYEMRERTEQTKTSAKAKSNELSI